MKRNRKIEEEKPFQLKALLGLAPKHYMLLAALAVVVLIGVLVAMAIANHQYRYVFVSTPSFSTVSIEGHGEGVTPWSTRLAPGEYSIHISQSDYEPLVQELSVGRRFIDIVFRRKRIAFFSSQQPSVSTEQLMANRYQQIHSWSLTGVDQQRYQKPPVISNAIEGVLHTGNRQATAELLRYATRDVGGREMLADWVRAAGTLYADEHPLLPLDIVQVIREAGVILHNNPRSEVLVELILEYATQQSGMALTALQQSQWREELIHGYTARAEQAIDGGHVVGDEKSNRTHNIRHIEIAGNDMIAISAGSTVIGGSGITDGAGGRVPQNGHPLTELRIIGVEYDFYFSTYEVSNAQFQRFLVENPQWEAQNRTALIDEGVVDEQYLHAFDANSDRRLPIGAVSWHAANAYCRWFQEQLPPDFSEYEVRLPTEREWLYVVTLTDAEVLPALFADSPRENLIEVYYAQRAQNNRPQVPRNTLGSVWEWNSNLFHVSDSYFEREATLSFSYTDGVYALQGGSETVKRNLIAPTTEAALYAQSAPPDVGFRLVITPRRSESAL